MLIPLQRGTVQRVQVRHSLFRQSCRNGPGCFPGIDILVVHSCFFQFRRGQRRGKGIAAQREEVIVHADPGHLQHFFKRPADCLLLRRHRGGIRPDLRVDIRFGQSKAIHFSVAVERDLLQPYEKSGNHVMGQELLQPAPDHFFVQVILRDIVGAQENLLAVSLEIPDSGITDPPDPAHGGFDFPGFHAVSVDFDHRIQAPGNHDVSIRQPPAHIAGMEYAVPKHPGRFFRHMNVAPEERIVETDFPLLPFGYFLSVFIQQPDPDIFEYRLSDGRDVIPPVYFKLCHMEPGLAHSVVVDQPYSFKPDAVRSLASCNQCFQACGRAFGHDAENGGGQESEVHPVTVELFIQADRIPCAFGGKDHQVHPGIQGIQENLHGSNEVQRSRFGHTGFRVDQVAGPAFQRCLVQLDFSVLLQHTFGLSGAAGSIDRKAGVMIRCPAESGKGGCLQDVLPRLLVNHQPAPAVLPDGFDPFRGIRIFHCGEGGPRFPDPEHRNKRTRVPWKTDQDEILRADSPAFQIAVNPGR